MTTPSLTHLDAEGRAHMVDIGDKAATRRRAIAEARITLSEAARDALARGVPKGDVFAAARIAGIQAAKRTAELIPLCHPLPLTKVAIAIEEAPEGLVLTATCETVGKTGVEMEALTAASVGALTIYDMLKAVEKGITFAVGLVEKSGGKSGDYQRSAP